MFHKAKLDTALAVFAIIEVELNFFHEREVRALVFLCFLRQKSARERKLALRATTGTGNEKRRTLRKSIICFIVAPSY